MCVCVGGTLAWGLAMTASLSYGGEGGGVLSSVGRFSAELAKSGQL